jgi:hypothetical protein
LVEHLPVERTSVPAGSDPFHRNHYLPAAGAKSAQRHLDPRESHTKKVSLDRSPVTEFSAAATRFANQGPGPPHKCFHVAGSVVVIFTIPFRVAFGLFWASNPELLPP